MILSTLDTDATCNTVPFLKNLRVMPSERYIYDGSARIEFYERIGIFHEKYIEHLLMSGVDKLEVDIEDIKMTKHPNTTLEYCKKVMGGVKTVKPFCTFQLMSDSRVEHECIFTELNDDNDWFANDIFMIQTVPNYPYPSKFSCQFWTTKYDLIKEDVLDFWEQ